jgi:hypothetical protein
MKGRSPRFQDSSRRRTPAPRPVRLGELWLEARILFETITYEDVLRGSRVGERC